jgi:hypothetical protein
MRRTVAVDRIGTAGLDCDISANPAECRAIAVRLDVPAVLGFACHFHLTRTQEGRGGEILAEGRLRATLLRVCVISLDEFEATIEHRFRVRFVPAGTESSEIDPEAEDELPYSHVSIDLGEAAVEELALNLDPYPRKPGAELPPEASEAAQFRVPRPPGGTSPVPHSSPHQSAIPCGRLPSLVDAALHSDHPL